MNLGIFSKDAPVKPAPEDELDRMAEKAAHAAFYAVADDPEFPRLDGDDEPFEMGAEMNRALRQIIAAWRVNRPPNGRKTN